MNPRRCVVAGSLLAAIAFLLLLWLRPWQQATEHPPEGRLDPRLEYAGPFRNVNPSVQYVSDSRCAKCHVDIAASYAEHPMGRSLLPVAQAPMPLAGALQNNPFEELGSLFRVEYEGNRARHIRTRMGPPPPLAEGGRRRVAAEQEWEVHYVIGSATRGYSYLTDRDGYLFQTPISWYSQKKKWDLSPGFALPHLTGRAVGHDCLFCHANRANGVESSVNRYTRPLFDGHAIGCQRCHGPGELHVAGPGAGKGEDGIDPTIVNPKHLAADLRQAVCEQCHLQGVARTLGRGREMYDFRPGLSLESCWSVFVRIPEAGDGRKAIGQVEQMYESRCFQGGPPAADSDKPRRSLGCISCHDPHEAVRGEPAERAAYYRGRCLQCHREPEAPAKAPPSPIRGRGVGGEGELQKGCSLPLADRLRRSAQDSCIECHMPPYGAADIPHTAVTDHRILRGGKVGPASRAGPESKVDRVPADGFPVVSFYRGRKGVDDAEDDRARAVAVMRLTLTGDPSAGRAARHVLPVLDGALRRDPDDLPAAEARAYALEVQDRSAEALAAFQSVLAKAPDRESALVGAALMAETLRKTQLALDFWRRVVAVNPWEPGYRQSLALLLVKQEAHDAALPECDAWVRLNPMSAEARAARVTCLLAAGNKDEARAEFARIEALAPANLRELQIRFAKKLK